MYYKHSNIKCGSWMTRRMLPSTILPDGIRCGYGTPTYCAIVLICVRPMYAMASGGSH